MGIRVDGLTHVYPNGVHALNGVSFEASGAFGLVGPNGAGKTTLMRILATLLPPTSGVAEVEGVPVDRVEEVRKILGYLPQHVDFYPSLTAFETLEYFSLLSDVAPRPERLRELLALVGLSGAVDRRVGGFSGGMKRRLGLAAALVHDPRVVIVDEPTAGLDPEGRIEVRNVLSALGEERTVLLSTHILPDVEAVCNRMAILMEGRIRFVGTPQELAARVKGKVVELRLPAATVDELRRNHKVVAVRYDGGEAIVRALWNGESAPQDGAFVEPSAEDGYFYLLHEASSGGEPQEA